ncbi:MAG: CerR family C-terminal domain-containing protein [Gammaproteobacteria bacterium]|jgi:AcrR family transcriptional regulator
MTIPEKRSDTTRLALIHAGLALFGEYGFKGTTTRALSNHAGANISAIPYYFGGKKGLYLAVMEYIVLRMQTHFGETREIVSSLLSKETIDKTEALDALKLMIRSMAQIFVESDEPKAWVQLIMREQARPTEAFDIIYNGQMVHIQHMYASLIAECTGLDPASDEVKLRCHALIGQILIFILSRESLLRHLAVKKLQPEQIKLIYSILINHAQACLKVPLLDT